ncbi:hypothetical protein PR003_g15627 [Phytophthora rubi]|uniref:Uncharacterized protein n=1 Tax=Phytophthora rubi TaxID=129364 RepID=A0A6A3LY05_9STRA|nr:hypothetical protein PR002_g23086 [Phytophthora rubi]KAE9022980.1 hypothetical protein PR001_g13020 [Phytophthora rubi]KAE9329089.1 hypothetical protein PR003_g15627 [Phytophthora rubi]
MLQRPAGTLSSACSSLLPRTTSSRETSSTWTKCPVTLRRNLRPRLRREARVSSTAEGRNKSQAVHSYLLYHRGR